MACSLYHILKPCRTFVCVCFPEVSTFRPNDNVCYSTISLYTTNRSQQAHLCHRHLLRGFSCKYRAPALNMCWNAILLMVPLVWYSFVGWYSTWVWASHDINQNRYITKIVGCTTKYAFPAWLDHGCEKGVAIVVVVCFPLFLQLAWICQVMKHCRDQTRQKWKKFCAKMRPSWDSGMVQPDLDLFEMQHLIRVLYIVGRYCIEVIQMCVSSFCHLTASQHWRVSVPDPFWPCKWGLLTERTWIVPWWKERQEVTIKGSTIKDSRQILWPRDDQRW